MENMMQNPIVYRGKYLPDTGLEKFQKTIERKYNVKFDCYKELHKWSVENYTNFWEEMWYFCDVVASEPYKKILLKTGPGFLDNEWFSGAKLNYAENILRIRDDRVALSYLDELGNEETVTFAQMFEEVKQYSAAFRRNGLEIGDRVACFMSNRKEAVFAFLAVASIGAMWGGPQPFLGALAASNIIRDMDPKFLISVDAHQYNGVLFPTLEHLTEIVKNGPSIEKVILVVTKDGTRKKDISNIRNCVFLEDFLHEGRTPDGGVPDIVFEQLSFNHPLHINYTSGTTGTPKAIVHSAGTFIAGLRDLVLSYDIKCGDTFCLNIPVGWCVWDLRIPCLALGARLFLLCSSEYYNHDGKNYWDVMAKYNVTHTVLVTSAIDKMEKMGIVPSPDTNMDCLKIISLTGSPVKKENFEFLKNKVNKDAYVFHIYGSTETFGYSCGFNLNMPWQAGEVQIPSLGMDVQCFDSEGKSVIGQRGELVYCTPAINFPLGLWKDVHNRCLTETYLTKFPGVWCQQDICWFNPKTDGFIVISRSDNTLKQFGDRFSPEDIYFAIHSLKTLQDYVCVSQTRDDGESRVILFVKMQKGHKLTPEVKDKIEKKITKEQWEDHVPQLIIEIPDIPYNMNSKRTESVVRKIVQTNLLPENVNIKNPASLKHFLNISEIVNYIRS